MVAVSRGGAAWRGCPVPYTVIFSMVIVYGEAAVIRHPAAL